MGTAVHMISLTVCVPGMWAYLKSLGATVNYIGWGFAAFPFGAWATSRYLRDAPLGPIKLITRPSVEDTEKNIRGGRVKRSYKGKPFTRSTYAFLIMIAIIGNCIYAFGPSPEVVLVGRVLAGVGASGMVLTHKYVEYSTGGDEMMVRPRMVMLGAAQAAGSIMGIILAIGVAALPPVTLVDHELTSQPVAALIVAVLYLFLLPAVYATYDSVAPKKEVIEYIDQTKGEIDAPPSNYMSAQRLGVLVPAVIYDRGQAQPSSLPDVFSTAVVLVLYFMTNNLIVGIEVAHGPFCDDIFQWDALDTSITFLSFVLAGVIGIMLSLSLSDEVESVPCNRRLFGALVLMFVTYGLMLQAATPKEQYIAFLVIMSACFAMTDLAITEIHIDKIGEDDDMRTTASNKQMVMSMLNSTASFTRIVSSIVVGYIYSYWSENGNIPRRPYAVYGCGFGVVLLLVIMTIIFYKRFQFRSLENQILPPDKAPLGPQIIDCMDQG